ncbi:uncharacterized protein [Littorina saxatilis]|uniref:Uncharacterized protein n=1 Tax=Littorina saxatilis TaxID=31220 RepID=A0AAN9GES2_9CAEN
MADARPDKNPTLTERDVIIIACVCAVIIITLLIVLICFICRRRRANGKEYDNSGVPPPASNGGVPVKKMQQGPGQSYDNAGMVLHDSPDRGTSSVPLSSNGAPRSAHANTTNVQCNGRYPTFASSSEHPPTYWDSNSPDHDLDGHYDHRNNLSFDSQIDRQLYEHELNRRNDLAIYGRADGFRGQQESIHMQSRPMSPSKDKYIDLEDRKDPSLQSQESGYSTGDINKPKKVIYEVVV